MKNDDDIQLMIISLLIIIQLEINPMHFNSCQMPSFSTVLCSDESWFLQNSSFSIVRFFPAFHLFNSQRAFEINLKA